MLEARRWIWLIRFWFWSKEGWWHLLCSCFSKHRPHQLCHYCFWVFSFPCVFIKSIKCQGEWPKDSGYSIDGIDNQAKVIFLSNISTENTFVFSSPCFLLEREIINERSEHQDRQQKASKQTGKGSFYLFLHDFSPVFRI